MADEVSDIENILCHALGLPQSRSLYRNQFAAATGTSDYAACERMVKCGFMFKGQSLGYGDYFHCTEAGKRVAIEHSSPRKDSPQ